MRRIILWAAAVALTVGISAAPAGATRPPAVRVTPHGHLVGGQQVTVKWKRFSNTAHPLLMTIEECNPLYATDGLAACAGIGGTAYSASGSQAVTVMTGPVGQDGGTCGTSVADAKCTILVQSRSPINILEQVAVPIRFTIPV